jgi:hypothetical protein
LLAFVRETISRRWMLQEGNLPLYKGSEEN